MKEMAKHVPDAWTFPDYVVDESALMACIFRMTVYGQLLPPQRNRDALSIARDLDAKVEDVLRQAAA